MHAPSRLPRQLIRGGGVGCPFREIRSLLGCKALCEEYEGQCYTFVHNKYAECYLRAEHAGAGVADHPRHRTVSCAGMRVVRALVLDRA